MTCDEAWTEAVDGAPELAERTEFWRRAAISRLYYAAYHLTGRALQFDTTRADSNHRRLLETMRDRGGAWLRLCNRLEQLQRSRVTADYFLRRDVTRQAVLTAVNDARAVRELLGTLAS